MLGISFGVTPVKPSVLLGLLEDKVKETTGIASDRCFLSVAPDESHTLYPPGDQFVTVFPARFPMNELAQSVVSGAGAAHTGFDAQVTITVFTRLNLDQEFRDSRLLREASIGMISMVSKMIGDLQFWTAPVTPATTPPSSYLREYMRIVDGPVVHPKAWKPSTWALCKTTWDMKFTADLT